MGYNSIYSGASTLGTRTKNKYGQYSNSSSSLSNGNAYKQSVMSGNGTTMGTGDLTGSLNERLGYYSELADKVALSKAALAMQKTVKEEEKIDIPDIVVSLGNINISQKAKELANQDLKELKEAFEKLGSGDPEDFLKGLRTITGETNNTLKGKFSGLSQPGAANFTANIAKLIEADTGQVIPSISSLTGYKTKTLTASVRGVNMMI